MTKRTRNRRATRLCAMAMACGLLVTACGSDDDDATSTQPAASAPADTAGSAGTDAAGSEAPAAEGDVDEATLAESQQRMEMFYAGVDRALPSSSPKPDPGKKIWIISCGEAAEGCSSGSKGFSEAAALIDWEVTVFDGELNPQKWNEGIRQAIAAKADAIVVNDFDCAPVKGALEEAHAAGIPIIAWYAYDCTEGNPSEKDLFDIQISYGDKNFKEWSLYYGESIADWLITKTGAKAKAIVLTNDELLVVKYLVDGFEQRFAECTSCTTLETYDFVLADLGTTLQQKTESLILQHPDADSIMAPYDAAVALGIGPAVVASGRNDELLVTGGEGFATNVGYIYDNLGQDHFTGSATRWTAWAAVDALNRYFHGEAQVDAGIGFRAGDLEHNLPPRGEAYDGTVDYRANYRKIWGVES